MTTIADSGLNRAPQLVADILEEYASITRRKLRRYLNAGTDRPYLDALVADYPSRGGKMMRASLCIATARALGAPLEQALCSAVSIELLHNALLIHDDIEDGSDERRGKPALHRLHGIPLALNAGDTLSLLSMEPLYDNTRLLGHRLSARIIDETRHVAWESAEGQALELGWRRDNRMDVSDEEYLMMILKKTCWLATIHPTRIGTLIAAGDDADLDAMFAFGLFFGAAFQIQDDVLNLAGDERYGKEINGDLWEGKRTLILGHAYRQSDPSERAKLTRLLAQPRERRTASQVAWIRTLIDEAGSIQFASSVARGLAGAALSEFDIIFSDVPDSRDKDFIRGLVTWTLERTS